MEEKRTYSTLTKERDEALMKKKDELIYAGVNHAHFTRKTYVDLIADSPAPRFYVSARYARKLAIYHYEGKPMKNPNMQKMAEDLANTFERVMDELTEPLLSINIWDIVVRQPAPSFYMTKERILKVIFGYTKHEHKHK